MPRSARVVRASSLEAEDRRLDALLAIEAEHRRRGVRVVVGVDEVGRGCLAGPVVAAAVAFDSPVGLRGVDDSKRLSAALREDLDERIRRRAAAVAVGMASAVEIDGTNILEATRRAMRRALDGIAEIGVEVDLVLIDAVSLPGLPWSQDALVHGDLRAHAIAAASIVAKVHRDGLMAGMDVRLPGWGFAEHKGYGTDTHRRALQRLGPCPEHRLTFAGVLASPRGTEPAFVSDAGRSL